MAWLQKKKRRNSETDAIEIYWWICSRGPTGKGKVRSRGIGFCSAEDAKRALKIFEGKEAAGETPMPTAAGSSPARRVIPTLREYLDATYLPVVARDKAKSTARSARTAANALNAILGDLPLNAITYKKVDEYLTKRREAHRRSRTLAIELWCLRACLQHAVDCGEVAAMPKLPTVRIRDRKAHVYLTPEQSQLVLEALRPLDVQPHVVTRGRPPIVRDRHSYVAVLLALNLGMRKGEILSRGWEDVRWDLGPQGTLLVRAKSEIGFEVKTRRERAVPLTPDVHDELLALHAEAGKPLAGWIFPAPGVPSQPRKDFKTALRRACLRAGVPVVHPHALRHTWATRLATSGVDRRSLMDLGGWTSSVVLDEIYAHAPESHKADIMARMGLGPRKRDDGS